MKPPTPTSRPASESSIYANVLGCVLFFAPVFYLQQGGKQLGTDVVLFLLALAMLPMLVVDIRRNRACGGYSPKSPFNPARILTKLVGLAATYGLLLLAYWALPEYQGEFYQRFHGLFISALPWIGAASIPYVAWLDNKLEAPEDGTYHLGLLVTGRWKALDTRMVGEHLKGWAVKGFFLPLMGTYLFQNIEQLKDFNYSFTRFMDAYYLIYHFMFSLDLLFACTGYLMTLKLTRTQIYSAEPTALGWIVCVMCYQPLWGMVFYPAYFTYDDGYYWDHLTAGYPVLQFLWGSAIVFCLGMYAWATVAFGYRFSNLTYRGLITCGPYRFTKHPAYIFKCISWWLVSVPFVVSQNWEQSAQQCLLLSGVCLIYFIRARTEENHLSNYPEYVAYAEWMNQHGLFAWVGRTLPFFAYDAKRAARSGSRVYRAYAGRATTAQAEG